MLRFAKITSINEQIVSKVESTIRNDFDVLLAKDNAEIIAHLLGNLDRKNRITCIRELEKKGNMLAASVKKKVFSFEGITDISDSGIQTLLRNIDKNILAVALKGSDNNIQELFFKNMSERAANIIRGDMEDQGPISMDQIEQLSKR